MTAQRVDIVQTGSPQTEASHSKMTRSASVVAIFTSLSRVTGLLRDLVTVHLFGATAASDAFVVAFTIPNMMRRFVAEGALTVAFIPVYTDVKNRQGETAAREFFRATLGLLSLFLVALVVVGVLGASYLVYGLASGFQDDPIKYAMATSLTQVMFPYVFFISLVGLFMGALNSRGHFTASAASPILLNLGMIIGAYFCRDWFEQPMMGMALGVILGGILQLVMHVPVLKSHDLLHWPTFNYRLPAVVRLGKLMIPAIFGVAAYQFNLIVLRQVGSYLPEGQLFYYYNADRLMQLALGIFATSIATAALPAMSNYASPGERHKLLETWAYSVRITNFITIPAALGLLMVSVPIASVLWLHGEYKLSDVYMTAYTTMAFAPGLIAIAMMRSTVQVFYALEDMNSPVYVSAACVLLNLIFGMALLRFEVVGLATAFTLSSFAQLVMLLIWMRRKLGRVGGKSLFLATSGQFISAFVGCLLAFLISLLGNWELGPNLWNVGVLFTSIGAAVLSYALIALYFGSPEAQNIFGMLKRRFR